MRLTWRSFWFLLQRTFIATARDNGFGIAKGAAYSALLSFFPMLATAATLLVQARADLVARTVADFLFEVVPPGTEQIIAEQFRSRSQLPASFLVGAGLLALWAASSTVKSLIEGFQAAYHLPKNRSYLHNSGVAILIVLGTIGPLLAASSVVVFGVWIDQWVMSWARVDPALATAAEWWPTINQLARYVIAFGAIVAVTSILYYFGPYRQQTWNGVWGGAFMATVFWLIATSVFGWYVRNVSPYNLLYGGLGSIIALLVWLYLISVIALIGCEFNAQYERYFAETAGHPVDEPGELKAS
ncbi:MAG: YihY/virulence factor BrkB family protein [Bryobacteraceae bacterium]